MFSVPNLYVVDVATGPSRVLLERNDVLQPSWSPHGYRIAFWEATRGQRDIFTIDAAGRPDSIQAITSDAAIDWNPVWSPDGRYLYFSSDRDGTMNVWRVAVDERTGKRKGELEPVRTPSQYAGFLSAVRSGDQLVYQSTSETAQLLRLTFEAQTERVTPDGTPLFSGSVRFRNVAPSPDGKWIAFTNIGPQEDLFIMAADGSTIRQLTNDSFRDRGVSWWPDGSRLVFYSNRTGGFEAWTIRPDGSGLSRFSALPNGVNFPVMAPDARHVAYLTDGATSIGTSTRIAAIDASGRMTSGDQLAQLPAGGFWPQSWSPDGKWLVGRPWRSTAITDTGLVYLYSLADRRLVTLPFAARAAAFVDNQRLLFIDDQQRIGLTNLTGSDIRFISRVPGDDASGFRMSDMAISAGGRTIVIYRRRVESDIWRMSLRSAAGAPR